MKFNPIKKEPIITILIIILSQFCSEPGQKKGEITSKIDIEINAEIMANQPKYEYSNGLEDIIGYYIGYSEKDNDLFILNLEWTFDHDESYEIFVFNAKSKKRSLNPFYLARGSEQSPKHIKAIRGFEKVNDFYFVNDNFVKIMILDKDFNHYSTHSLGYQPFYFIDFYYYNNEYFFLIAEKEYTEENMPFSICIYQIYPDSETKRINKINTIDDGIIPIHSIFPKNKSDKIISGTIWPTIFGFQTDTRIIYSDTRTPIINVYDLDTGEMNYIKLDFLKETKISYKLSENLKYRYLSKKSINLLEKRIDFVPYKKPLYHFGVIDAGSGYIGIIGEINFEKDLFRIDIIDKNYHYLKSYYFPYNYVVHRMIMTPNYQGELYLNYENKFIAFYDMNLDLELSPKLIDFKNEEE